MKQNLVFVISLIITVAVVIWALVAGDSFVAAINGVMGALASNFDWLYIYGATLFILFSIALAISPYGKTKLGGNEEKPEKSTLAWFAMLFSAGMGVGLVFWGVVLAFVAFAFMMSGGVSGIQKIAIIISFPFFLVMIVMCIAMVKALHEERHPKAGESDRSGDE